MTSPLDVQREQVAVLGEIAETLHRLERRAAPEPRQRLGHRSVPRRLPALAVLRALPWAAARFDREVPGTHLRTAENGTGEVSCTCGETVDVEVGAFEVGECGRAFINTGRRMLVAQAEVAG